MIKTVNKFCSVKALLIGDLILDRFIYGNSSRISREAPVLVLKYKNENIVPGGGGNAANNLLNLKSNLKVISLLGNDKSGKILFDYFDKRGVDMTSVISDEQYTTSAKTRIMAGGFHTTLQQVIRIDKENDQDVSKKIIDKLKHSIEKEVKKSDLIVLSDYGLGLFGREIIELINSLADKFSKKIFLIDSRYKLTSFKKMTVATPNEEEAANSVGSQPEKMNINSVGHKILDLTNNKNLIITRGSQGMAVFSKHGKTSYIPIYGDADISDVTGAGDTVSATTGMSLATGADTELAAKIATIAASIVVHKPGTVPIEYDELYNACLKVEKDGKF